MSLHRFFLAAPLSHAEGSVSLPLSAEDVRHAVNVLRIKAGESIEVVEPGGAAWRARVTVASKDGLAAMPLERLSTPAGPDVTLIQAVAKGEKMDAIVRQAVEVGVSCIVPVFTERTVVRLDDRKRVERAERWRRIAKSAAEQSHRTRIPTVAEPARLADITETFHVYDLVLVFWEEAGAVGMHDVWPDTRVERAAVIVGPEGGFEPSEVAELEQAGARAVTLGHTILRTETAAVVGAALVVHRMGGLGGVDE